MKKNSKKNPIPKEERDKLWCVDHEKFLPRLEFIPNGKTSAGKQKYTNRCRPCWYKHRNENHSSHKLVVETLDLIKEVKQHCVVCGYDRCKSAMEFHHINDDKVDNVFNMVGKYSLLEVQTEIEKCIVLCSNCHREFHEGIINLNGYIDNI